MVIANLVVSILGFFLRARLVQSHERTDAKSRELSDHEFGPVWIVNHSGGALLLLVF